MNVTKAYADILRYVSSCGKQSVLETFKQRIKKGTNFKYAGPTEFKTIPIGMPRETAVMKYDNWEKMFLESGCTKSYAVDSWFSHITPRPPKQLTRIEKELKKCFTKENIEKIEFFKTLTQQEKEYLSECYADSSFISTLTGHKPAWYNEHGFWGKIDFSRIKLNPKVADKFDVIKLPNGNGSLYFLNKKEVLKIIEENKDIYCAGQGLSPSATTEEIYNTLLINLEHGNIAEGKKGEALYGITLGFPRHSSMIYEMERIINGCKSGVRENIPLLKEKLLALLHSEKFPFKGYPKETIEKLEKHIKTMNVNDGVNTSICQCHTYGNEEKAIERILNQSKSFDENLG